MDHDKMAKRPIYVVLGGPNGAGKSTTAKRVSIGEFVNPDVVARQINPADPESPSTALEAGRRVLRRLNELKDQGQSFTNETTLASKNSLMQIDDAKAKGYEVRLYFVALATVDTSIDRVAHRVCEGGHNIPTDVLQRRFDPILANAVVASQKVDRFELIDNERWESKPILIIENNHVVARQRSEHPKIQALSDQVVEARFLISSERIPRPSDQQIIETMRATPGLLAARQSIEQLVAAAYPDHHALDERLDTIEHATNYHRIAARETADRLLANPKSFGTPAPGADIATLAAAVSAYGATVETARTWTINAIEANRALARVDVPAPSPPLTKILALPPDQQLKELAANHDRAAEIEDILGRLDARLSPEGRAALRIGDATALAASITVPTGRAALIISTSQALNALQKTLAA
jgi:predicted ABC-type ATPase